MKASGTWRQRLAALLATALLAACAAPKPAAEQYLLRDHPLVGKVWDAAARQFIEPAQLLQRASATRFVLLGEIHDNREHHRLQAQVLQAVAASRRPALVMEQYDREQQASINRVLQGGAGDKLPALAQLMRKGWEWDNYAPLAQLALQQHLPLIAANLSRDELRQVSRNGFAALGTGEEQRLALETAWSPERQSRLVRDIEAGHCGKMQQHTLEAIARAQRARDAVMADMLLYAKNDGAVAIVGSGHARRDMAIPLYLAARAPQASVLSLGLVEVDSPSDPAAYAYGQFGQLFDYIWFTPRVARQFNPCDSIPQPSANSAPPA